MTLQWAVRKACVGSYAGFVGVSSRVDAGSYFRSALQRVEIRRILAELNARGIPWHQCIDSGARYFDAESPTRFARTSDAAPYDASVILEFDDERRTALIHPQNAEICERVIQSEDDVVKLFCYGLAELDNWYP